MVMCISLSEKEKTKISLEIKKKNTLNNLDDQFILNLLNLYLNKHVGLVKKLKAKKSFEKSSEFKIVVKDIRGIIHDVFGLFMFDIKKVFKLFKEKDFDLEWHKRVLKCSKPTLERLNYYPLIYDQIFSITGKPKSIIDLGCGLNPLSLVFMDLKQVKYYAYDLSKDYSEIITSYFNEVGVDCVSKVVDLLNWDKFPKTDVCFLFKVLDGLELIELNYSKKLLNNIKSKFIIVSFATKSIKARRKFNRGNWFVNMLGQLSWSYKTFETNNEIFYVIYKKI